MADAQQVQGSKTRNYPPLIVAALLMLGLLAVLPSALNLPQSNPSQTLEYAPVPPEDEDQIDPPSGNFSSLGLGSGKGLGNNAAGDPGGQPDQPGGDAGGRSVKLPGTKRCVGNPPRQTEDPSSPPCVASFTGDNGGATYQGVSRDEVRVILYREGGFTRPTSRGSESSPSAGGCFDLGKPAAENEDVEVRVHRALQRYFNERYQTYGRFVRFITCFSKYPQTAESRRAEAAQQLRDWKPFAFVNMANLGFRTSYSEVMVRRGTVGFSSFPFQPAEFFQRSAPLLWSYLPSLESYAQIYSSYICEKVVPHPVSFSGNATDQGTPRKFGLLRTDNTGHQDLQAFASLVKQQVEKCGGQFVAEATYPFVYSSVVVSGDRPNYAQENMARFRDSGVTTVIWPGGWEADHSKAAAQLGYRPEWVLAGDDQIEGYDMGQFQEPSAWQHAWVVSHITREGEFDENLCYAAIREADSDFPREDAAYACPLGKLYESLRQLFVGIQVAGPRLNPASVDKGYHAIPAVRSNDPRVAACFFEPGDYTCVKDASVSWWDPASRSRNGRQGCWRMPEDGRRYLPGTWPSGDVPAQRNAQRDPCNGYAASIFGN